MRSRRGGWKKARRLKQVLLSQGGLDPSVFKQPDAFHEPAVQQASLPPLLSKSLFLQPMMACMPHQVYQMQLENGTNDILQYSPATTSVVKIENVESDTNINAEPRTFEEKLESEVNKETDELIDVVECLNNEQVVKINTHTKGRPTDTKRRRRTTKTIQRIKKKIYSVNKEDLRTNVQLQQTRIKFAKISESNAKALQLFAEAAMKQANAAMIAAENDRQRNVLDEQRLTLDKKKLQVDENVLQTLNSVHKLMEKILDKNK
ncbi:PREDICTED: uncharacterized protein LOC108749419 isoform X2 [Trachymyrmex septentrionalis]|nr:PREDICTED: uncharacterized protein LOC108749419 isoform X2 [Trachymyrmex septentrionalis]XP_018343639.1 PREDICTED: uncharacterized protein LOC108749419 isoform X2 [Trachymyrmex septentrionalis]XP_018343650.1 PREDICTED: uncharacterized protein LOC108749419 isoform X2 [Trachymyrmex septentrionalis]